MEDTEVSTRTVGDLRSDGAEEFGDRFLVLQVAEDDAAGVGRIFLGFGDKRLCVGLDGLCLRDSRLNPLVEDKGGSHVGKRRFAVTALASKMIDCFIVSHC